MTKTFDLPGQDSTYTFNIKVAAKAEADEIIFKAGSYLYIEFARDISPRLN